MPLIPATDPNHFVDNLPVSPEALKQEGDLLSATHVLAMRSMQAREPRGEDVKELQRAEAQARLHLAACIIALDEVDKLVESGEKIHSMQEQAAVEAAQREYAQALADLIRGHAS